MGIGRRLAGAIVAAGLALQPAAAAWHEASSEHFVVYADEDPETLRDLATRLERFDRGMRVIRGIPDRPVGKANRLIVYVLKDQRRVQQLLNSAVAGFYKPRAGEALAVTGYERSSKGSDYDYRLSTLFHEYTHHFLYANFPDAAYPMWFSEGYADFAGAAQFNADGGLRFGAPDLNYLRYMGYIYGRMMSVPTMLASEFSKVQGDAVYALYSRGWLLAHYLQFEPSRKGQLSRYLAAINAGKPGAVAAREAFGDPYALDRELERYRGRKVFPQLVLSPAALAIGPIAIRALDPGEAATMPVRIRVKNSDTDAQTNVRTAARRAADDFPASAAAQTVLAEAEFDARDYAAAEAAADRAIAADPKALEAMLYKGRARMARAVAAGATDAATWKEVRRWFLGANRLDPDDPRPLVFYYRSFAAAKAAPTASAVSGLVYAFGLAPQDLRLRLLVARQYVHDGKGAEAATVLKPIAFNPHGGELATFAGDVVGLLGKGDIAAARARFDDAPAMVRNATTG